MMNWVFSYRFQPFVFALQILFLGSIIGSYTNWFREGMDLVTTLLVVAFTILAILLLLPIHVFCAIRSVKERFGRLDTILLAVSTLLFVITIIVSNIVLFGRVYLPLEGRVFSDDIRSFTDSRGLDIDWHVEFVNPYLDSHKERLILSNGEEQKTIYVHLLEDKNKFGVTGADHLSLNMCGTNLLLRSTVEISKHTRYVMIDYTSGTVLSNWVESATFTENNNKDI